MKRKCSGYFIVVLYTIQRSVREKAYKTTCTSGINLLYEDRDRLVVVFDVGF